METIGERIEQLMKKKGINRSTLAKLCNVAPTTITNCIEKNSVKSELLTEMSKIFDVSVDFIIFGHEEYKDFIEENLMRVFRELNHDNKLKVVKEATGLKGIQDLEIKKD